MNEKLIAALSAHYDKLAQYDLLGEADYISVRCDDGMLIMGNDRKAKHVSFGADADKEEQMHLAVYAGTDAGAIVHAYPGYVSAVAEAGVSIPAVLDDMAQIVGPTCRTCKGGAKAVAKELKKRNSCLIKGDGAVTTGRTLDEAFTCMLVLQKAAICYVGASVLGGNKIINGFEARLMRFVYKKKYSKVNTANNMAKEGEK